MSEGFKQDGKKNLVTQYEKAAKVETEQKTPKDEGQPRLKAYVVCL